MESMEKEMYGFHYIHIEIEHSFQVLLFKVQMLIILEICVEFFWVPLLCTLLLILFLRSLARRYIFVQELNLTSWPSTYSSKFFA